MWASRARYQASVKGKISSLHWLEASSVDGTEDSAGAGWIAAGGTRSDLSISWFSRAREEKERGSSNACPTQSGSTIYKSHFNLRGHSVGVGQSSSSPLFTNTASIKLNDALHCCLVSCYWCCQSHSLACLGIIVTGLMIIIMHDYHYSV